MLLGVIQPALTLPSQPCLCTCVSKKAKFISAKEKNWCMGIGMGVWGQGQAFLGTFKDPWSWCEKGEMVPSLDISVFSSKLKGLAGFDFDRHLFTCFKAHLPSRPLLSGFVCSLIPQVTLGWAPAVLGAQP